MSETDPNEKPQILVDDDWKSQAQAEKEKLAEAEAQAKEQGGAGDDPRGRGLPPADFSALIDVMVTMVLPYLGGVADKETGGVMFDPEISRFYIDLLSVVEEKTKGNLSDEESKKLSEVLTGMRMQYVELSKLLAQQVASGGAGAAEPGGPGSGVGPVTG